MDPFERFVGDALDEALAIEMLDLLIREEIEQEDEE